ncbi:unnamed protein product [Cercopithifilaria johnstoni]|uniref:PIN domain-containing protein n=1 Tax=Cercopithifilaria johnstoni TaxID=2874296 RepID=A0A8J2M268_9BILA|nr:unnamed protein product [Cercopithifilaria johnstoni]
MDLVIREIRSYRQQNFWCPNVRFGNHSGYARSNIEIKKNSVVTLIVFDTSGLLRDTGLLPLCIEKLCHVLIPYTVLKELDGLKKTDYEKLRTKVIRTHGFLHDYSKSGCCYLHIENMFEASFGVEEFGCENNDDIILKCALITTKRYRSEKVSVIFVTNDKSLAVKALAHNIFTLDRKELVDLLLTKAPEGKKELLSPESLAQREFLRYNSAGSSAQQKLSQNNFLHSAFAKHFNSKIRNNLVVPNQFGNYSSPVFAPATFMFQPGGQIIMQNYLFRIQNIFRMLLCGEPSFQLLQKFFPLTFQMFERMVKVTNFNSFKY